MQDGRVQAFDIGLHEVDVEDKGGRFGLYKVTARIPWTLNTPTQTSVRYAGGHLLKLPLGATDLAPRLNGYSLTAPELRAKALEIGFVPGASTPEEVTAMIRHDLATVGKLVKSAGIKPE